MYFILGVPAARLTDLALTTTMTPYTATVFMVLAMATNSVMVMGTDTEMGLEGQLVLVLGAMRVIFNEAIDLYIIRSSNYILYRLDDNNSL